PESKVIHWEKYGKYWYTDFATLTTLVNVDYRKTTESFRKKFVQALKSDYIAERLKDKTEIRYTDFGTFAGDKTVVALEQLCNAAIQKGSNIERIAIEIIEPSPGLRVISKRAVEKKRDELKKIEDADGNKPYESLDIDIFDTGSYDVRNLKKFDPIANPDMLRIYAFQNIWTNFSDWQELQQNFSKHIQSGDVIIYEGDPNKIAKQYKGEQEIAEDYMQRYGIQREDVHQWFKNQRFSRITQGHKYSDDGLAFVDSKDNHVREYVKLENQVTAQYHGKPVLYKVDDGIVKIVLPSEDEYLKLEFREGIPVDTEYRAIVFEKGTIFQTLLSQECDCSDVDTFYTGSFGLPGIKGFRPKLTTELIYPGPDDINGLRAYACIPKRLG
ncbi:MAG: hypothetical protein KKF44_05795, partial [Nanoarchaeota archaeon]|nr:hypothetical protein [Nanoarchaeota archaeon]